MPDTIFALSSGAPPAAIAVVRISGPAAGDVLERLGGRIPAPRRATRMRLRDREGDVLDDALVLWLPGPGTATGEDTVELHCHGGRAVIAAIERALAAIPQLRRATAGEFTRRGFANGRIDLAEAEGLADLLAAETELQRRSALAMAEGAVSRVVEHWRLRLLEASGLVEAVLDFADEDDVTALPGDFTGTLETLRQDIHRWLARPRAEVLREGFRVVLAGPPNAGKSTLFNALVESDAAITAAIAGTTRDVLTRPVALEGIPFVFVDTAGLRHTTDEVEALGVGRAKGELERADLVLWLGPEGEGPDESWEIAPQIDRSDYPGKQNPRHRVSATTERGMDGLRHDLVQAARQSLPRPGEVAVTDRQRLFLSEAHWAIGCACELSDPLLIAEHLRLARLAFDSLVGRAATEDMLDALFGRFCIGK